MRMREAIVVLLVEERKRLHRCVVARAGIVLGAHNLRGWLVDVHKHLDLSAGCNSLV